MITCQQFADQRSIVSALLFIAFLSVRLVYNTKKNQHKESLLARTSMQLTGS